MVIIVIVVYGYSNNNSNNSIYILYSIYIGVYDGKIKKIEILIKTNCSEKIIIEKEGRES